MKAAAGNSNQIYEYELSVSFYEGASKVSRFEQYYCKSQSEANEMITGHLVKEPKIRERKGILFTESLG